MSRNIVVILLWSLFTILFQVLVLNNVYLWGLINPYIYIFTILMLPLNFRPWISLVAAFSLGVVVDMFCNTLGLHTAATLTMAYFRPFVLRIIAPREGYESESSPDIYQMGFSWYIRYTGLLVFIHHMVLFYLEVFRFTGFFDTLLRVAFSWISSMILIILLQYLTQKPPK